MLLRKINAGLSLLTTILLLDHAVFFSVWMLSRCRIEKSASFMPRMLALLMVIHAVLCVIQAVKSRKGAEKRKCKAYPQMNIATYVQRITGVLMLLMIGLHVAGSLNHFQPKALHSIFQPLFFAAALAHASVSASKALITLGIGNAKSIKIVDAVMKVLCGATLVAGVIGFYICLFVGVAK